MRTVLTVRLITILLLVGSMANIATVSAQLPDFTQMVEKYSPAVVNISTTQKIVRGERGGSPHGWGGPDAPFDDFLRRFFGDEFDGEEQPDAESLGSGFIISADGYILTNSHVIREADEIIVRLNDRRELEAEVIGFDKRSDIALLKVDAKDLPTVAIGDPTRLKVGSWVLAIGSPFGFDYTVTAGIVSAKGRSLPNENYVPFIQTDVAINPGNSGGPLFSLDGKVIGVNAQIYSRTGGYMGLAFAIPIDVAMNVVEQLKTTGHVKRGWLGILIQDVTRELAESFAMDKPVGALVAKVLPDSPADKAGLKVGDIILEFGGREVKDSSSLPPMVGSSAIGESEKVKIIRNGKKQQLNVVIHELPEEDELELARQDSNTVSIKRLAMAVSDLSDDERKQLANEVDGGVFVESIKPGPASHAGLRKGDIIVQLNSKDVVNARQFQQQVEDLPKGKSFPILVYRRTGPVFLAIKLDE